jgi:formamidopyrimidine-DNA glycosylase
LPELPEVETIVRGLAPRIAGRRIQSVELRQPRVLINDVGAAAGTCIVRVRRWGKHIIIDLDRGHLIIHLGMTGQLLLDAPAGGHTHAVFLLDRGMTLVFNDIRQFGRLELAERLPTRLERLGPEPLALSETDFVARLRARRAMLKPLLLNQEFLRGLGNIYADEALFRARLHPRALASRLRQARAGRLYRAIVEVLTESIRHGGTSISDYVGSDGRRGGFQNRLRVYGRAGEPCRVCGAAIRRIVLASRGTHFCPRCQRI